MILIVLLFGIREPLKDLVSIVVCAKVSPFLFLLVAELLSIQIVNNQSILGLKIFDREVKISQMADGTALFLRDKSQANTALNFISKFTKSLGLKLNLYKCDILFIHDSVDLSIENLPVNIWESIFLKIKLPVNNSILCQREIKLNIS